MIRYALTCADGHAFEAWFRDSAAYEAQRAASMVHCAVCGGGEVEKALMTPSVARRDGETPRPALSAPADSPPAQALAALRAMLERVADSVGPRFAEEARRRHAEGDGARPVWGQATPAEARALTEEGVPVAPLPFLPRRDD